MPHGKTVNNPAMSDVIDAEIALPGPGRALVGLIQEMNPPDWRRQSSEYRPPARTRAS